MNTVSEYVEKVEPWETPIDFLDPERPAFPVSTLPAWQAEFVAAIAEETQTPPDLAAMFALTGTAGAAAKRYEVRPFGAWLEPLNLYGLCVLPPGERKSAVAEAATEPIRRAQEDARHDAEPCIAAAEMEHARLAKRVKKLQGKAANVSEQEAVPLLKEASELTALLRAKPVPARPRLLYDDITPEKIPGVLQEQGGRAMIASAEGGLFETIAGRYNPSGTPNIDATLKAHAGDDIAVDRVSRSEEYIRRPALTIALAVQPEVLRSLTTNPSFRGKGLLARFAYFMPRPMVGRRSIHVDPVPDVVRTEYLRRTRNLWNLAPKLGGDGCIEPRVLAVTPEARDALDAYRAALEPRLAPDGDLGAVADWASKLAGLVVRLAANLHLADPATDPADPPPIAVGTIERAMTLGDYFREHALLAFRAMRQDANAENAADVLAWLRRRGQDTFTKRDVHVAKRSRFPEADDLDPVLAFLVKTGWIRPLPRQRRPGRPSEGFEVHPSVRG
jgi:hypothetical protein